MKRYWPFVAAFLVLAACAVLLCLAVIAELLYRSRPLILPANQLVTCAEKGDVAGVEYWLAWGVSPNASEKWGWHHEHDGETPLTAAARTGQVEVVRLLLRKGADVDLRDGGPNKRGTPLFAASGGGHIEVCKVLLEAGADPNIRCGDPKGWTALDWALQLKKSAVADLLRQHGAVEGARRNGPDVLSLPAP